MGNQMDKTVKHDMELGNSSYIVFFFFGLKGLGFCGMVRRFKVKVLYRRCVLDFV